MIAHTIELDVTMTNGDTGHQDDSTVKVELDEGQLDEQIQALRSEVSNETLINFLKGLYAEPGRTDMPKGAAYDHLLAEFTTGAYDDLGWHDVSVSVSAIRIDGEPVEVTDDQLDEILYQEMAIQLVRDDRTMYLRNL